MREATFSDPLDKAIKRHAHAVEQLRKVAHYHDREWMGRAPTDSEKEDYKQRSRAVVDSLHKICAFPCPDFATLRRKAKWLALYLKEQSLGQYDERALVTSILNMPRKGDVG
ncbi:MAG: hypothetical protein H3C60_14335 [Sphingomonadaceae bacterium]|nr:hypothetical protein [Sphingomonadaceae bacterium]